MPVIHETEVDGVRCFWVETGRPTLAARLLFRYGMVDEPMVESGWQHLIEHLALEGRGGGALQVNGSISLLHTAFDTHGPVEAVVGHLRALSMWLSEPQLSRLGHESKVLRAEAALRDGNVSSDALLYRYGANGPGLAAYQGPGIGRATPELLADRAARVLTRGNAVLVLDGPPPVALRLHLVDGQRIPHSCRRPVRPAETCRLRAVPRSCPVGGRAQVAGVMSLGHDLLRQALQDELRTNAGAAYAPWVTYEPVDDENAVVIGGSDVSRELMSTIANRTLQLVRKLRAYTPASDRLDELRAAALQHMNDPLSRMGMAVATAAEALSGREPWQPHDWVDQVQGVTGTEIRDAFEEFHASLLFGVPGEATWDHPLPLLRPASNTTAIRGRRWRSVNWPADATRLRIDDHGVELRAGKDERTVSISTVMGVLAFEDGPRYIVPRDGFGIWIDPRDWRRGHRAVQELDQMIPTELVLPYPARESPAPERVGFVRRWTWPVRRRMSAPSSHNVAAVVAIGACVALIVAAVVADQTRGIFPLVILTIFLARTITGSKK